MNKTQGQVNLLVVNDLLRKVCTLPEIEAARPSEAMAAGFGLTVYALTGGDHDKIPKDANDILLNDQLYAEQLVNGGPKRVIEFLLMLQKILIENAFGGVTPESRKWVTDEMDKEKPVREG